MIWREIWYNDGNKMRILHIATGLQKASGVTTFVENVVSELRTLVEAKYTWSAVARTLSSAYTNLLTPSPAS